MPQIPSLLEMLKAGVHFGHQTSKWYPTMAPYIFAERSGIHIINLLKTRPCLEEALQFVTDLVRKKGVILFVGTKKQAQIMVREEALACQMPYVDERWIGGTLTNFSVISKLIQKYKTLKKKQVAGELQKYTKKEQLEFERRIARLEKLVGGLVTLESSPQAIFVIDVKKEKTAVREARQRKNVSVVALCDTNVNPELVDYPIPCNDDATKALRMMIHLVAEAVMEGRLLREQDEPSEKEVGKPAVPTKLQEQVPEPKIESTPMPIDGVVS